MTEEKLRFNEGEKVFCFHGPLLYEGKIQKIKVKDKIAKYFIHYSGWNSKWDEWVSESRIMEHCEETIKRQKELKQQHLSKKGKGVKNPKEEKREEKREELLCCDVQSSTLPPPVKKRKARPSSSINDQSRIKKVEVRVVIPKDLQRYLLDDCDFVLRQKQLVPLPKPEDLTVSGILNKYEKFKADNSNDGSGAGSMKEVCCGINEYFNVMVGSHLLYKFERLQYSDLLKEYPDKQMVDIYGAEHLLRLFVKLTDVLPQLNDESSMEFIVVHVHDFLDFLLKNCDSFFVDEYENSTPDYHRRIVV